MTIKEVIKMTLLTISIVAVLLLCLAYFIVIRAVRAEQTWMKMTGFVLSGMLVLTVLAAPLFMVAGGPMGGFGGRGREMAMGRQMGGQMMDRGQGRFGNDCGGNDRMDRQPNGRQGQGRQMMPWGQNNGQCPFNGQPGEPNGQGMPNNPGNPENPNQGGNLQNPGMPNQGNPGQNMPNPGAPNQGTPKAP